MANNLKHSTLGSHNRQKFFERVNDFNLYVEDSRYEFWYKEIMYRMGYKIFTVVASGDKYKIVDDYHRYGDKTSSGKFNFYLTDGDFWRYKNPEEMIISDCFIYLQTYNIESNLVDENYSINFLKGRLQTDESGVRASGFDFNDWKQQIVAESYEMFLNYAAIESLTSCLGTINPKISEQIGKTVSRAKRFLDYNTGFTRKEDYKNEKERIERIINSNGLIPKFNAELNKIKTRYVEENNEDYYNLICGKYLLTGLQNYIKNILHSKGAQTKTIVEADFIWSCIQSFDINKLSYVKSVIDNKLSAS